LIYCDGTNLHVFAPSLALAHFCNHRPIKNGSWKKRPQRIPFDAPKLSYAISHTETRCDHADGKSHDRIPLLLRNRGFDTAPSSKATQRMVTHQKAKNTNSPEPEQPSTPAATNEIEKRPLPISWSEEEGLKLFDIEATPEVLDFL
jgi:hypothetical protein